MFCKYAKEEATPLLRPCMVDDKPAVFHQWCVEDRALLKIDTLAAPDTLAKLVSEFRVEAVIPQCCHLEKLRSTYALVEYADGSVGKVDPKLIQFLDREG